MELYKELNFLKVKNQYEESCKKIAKNWLKQIEEIKKIQTIKTFNKFSNAINKIGKV